jgi:hypothetical protein
MQAFVAVPTFGVNGLAFQQGCEGRFDRQAALVLYYHVEPVVVFQDPLLEGKVGQLGWSFGAHAAMMPGRWLIG